MTRGRFAAEGRHRTLAPTSKHGIPPTTDPTPAGRRSSSERQSLGFTRQAQAQDSRRRPTRPIPSA